MRRQISANGRPRNREDQRMSLHTRKFQLKGRKEEKMTWTTLLSVVAAKMHIFQGPWILRRPDTKSRRPFGQNSHIQSFFFLYNI